MPQQRDVVVQKRPEQGKRPASYLEHPRVGDGEVNAALSRLSSFVKARERSGIGGFKLFDQDNSG